MIQSAADGGWRTSLGQRSCLSLSLPCACAKYLVPCACSHVTLAPTRGGLLTLAAERAGWEELRAGIWPMFLSAGNTMGETAPAPAPAHAYQRMGSWEARPWRSRSSTRSFHLRDTNLLSCERELGGAVICQIGYTGEDEGRVQYGGTVQYSPLRSVPYSSTAVSPVDCGLRTVVPVVPVVPVVRNRKTGCSFSAFHLQAQA